MFSGSNVVMLTKQVHQQVHAVQHCIARPLKLTTLVRSARHKDYVERR